MHRSGMDPNAKPDTTVSDPEVVAALPTDDPTAPHDRVGKVIEAGSQIAVMGGGRGTVTAVTPGEITYTRSDGTEATSPPGDIVVVAPPEQTPSDATPPATAPGAVPPQTAVAPEVPGAPAPAPEATAPPAAAPEATPPGAEPAAAAVEPLSIDGFTTAPAPDSTPDGADAWLVNDEATAQAWLRTDEGDEAVGYVQTDTNDPATVVRFAATADWAVFVDSMGVHPADDGAAADSPPKPAGDPAAEEKPAAGKVPEQFKGAPAPITPGSFVTWDGGARKGLVDLAVTSGKVPGVAVDVDGTKAAPAARVVVWVDGAPTTEKVAVKAADLTRIASLVKADTHPAGADVLVPLVAQHADRVDTERLPGHAHVSGKSAKAAYARGIGGWPGAAATTVSAHDWAVGRVKALLTVAAGGEVPGFERDRDLLHHEHPLAPAADGSPVKAAAVEPETKGVAIDLRADLAALAMPE